jgi:hypothetical protein
MKGIPFNEAPLQVGDRLTRDEYRFEAIILDIFGAEVEYKFRYDDGDFRRSVSNVLQFNDKIIVFRKQRKRNVPSPIS